MCPFTLSPHPSLTSRTLDGDQDGRLFLLLSRFTRHFAHSLYMTIQHIQPYIQAKEGETLLLLVSVCQRSLYLHTDGGSSREKDHEPHTHTGQNGKESGTWHLTSNHQKGGVPAAPSGTATLLRLSPNHRFRPRPILAATDFRRPRLSWLDGRCVQGPGTYSPRHG